MMNSLPGQISSQICRIWCMRVQLLYGKLITDYGCPLKFLHTLEIDQGLLTHTHKGDEGPPKNFNRENLKLGLTFSVLGSITSGLVGVSS